MTRIPLDEMLEQAVARKPQPTAPETLPPHTAVTFLERYLPFKLALAWRVVIAAAWGLALELDEQRRMLVDICGFDEPHRDGYAEVLVVAGRRSGKSAVIGNKGLYMATVEGPAHMAHLAPGQRGYVVIIAARVRQALETFRYARATVERNPELLALLDGEPLESLHGGELRFKSGVVLTVMPASKASVRGYTVIGAILDEFAWISTDEDAANADEEIESAIRFAMLAPAGAPRRRKIVISSPAAKAGVVYETCTKHHGDPAAPVLVARGPTWLWNPSIDRAVLEAERERDPKRYAREVEAQFVDAVSAWCDGDVIEASAEGRGPEALPPRQQVRFFGAVDMAFRRDSSALAIGFEQPAPADAVDKAPVFVVAGVWRWTPTPGHPLDAHRTVAEMASIALRYGVRELVGDQFAITPLAEAFQRQGVALRELTATSTTKRENFTRLRERFYRGKVSLPRHDVALRELRELQERVTGGGNVQIGHPNRATAHDDCASAIAWLCAAVDEGRGAEWSPALMDASRDLARQLREDRASLEDRLGQFRAGTRWRGGIL